MRRTIPEIKRAARLKPPTIVRFRIVSVSLISPTLINEVARFRIGSREARGTIAQRVD